MDERVVCVVPQLCVELGHRSPQLSADSVKAVAAVGQRIDVALPERACAAARGSKFSSSISPPPPFVSGMLPDDPIVSAACCLPATSAPSGEQRIAEVMLSVYRRAPR